MDKYLLFPYNQQDLNNRIFQSPYSYLRQELRRRDIDIQTYDCGDLKTAKKILFFNHKPKWYAYCRKLGLLKEQLILFLIDPAAVIPEQYKDKVLSGYGSIFTMIDNLVDNKHFLKIYYPQGQHFVDHLPGWQERKFMVLMNANKYSYVTNELYTLRRQSIEYFEKKEDFDLYGYGWDHNGTLNINAAFQAFRMKRWGPYLVDLWHGFKKHTSFRGISADKAATLRQYRFCLAFENEQKKPGYITEKIFDSLFSGTIPIYLGASNIVDYIPEDCFIDFRKFSNFTELEKFLRNMDQRTFLLYQTAGQRFLRSSAFDIWSPHKVFRSVAEKLTL